jgi:nitronate monooxygenase
MSSAVEVISQPRAKVFSQSMSITHLFGIELPLIQAPMAGVQDSALAIAVSNAGGLGSLPCAMLSPDALRRELGRLRDGTKQPFNVNFFCHRPLPPDAAKEMLWRQKLASFYAEFGLQADPAAGGASRRPFDDVTAQVLREFAPPVVSFHFGLPAPTLLDIVKSWGAKVLSSATTVAEAQWLEANGADAIIAQGLEAGGHRGHFLSTDTADQPGTMALVPQIMDAVKVPVIAAGGIADKRGVAAALALGAAGVQIGTSYLLCPESTTSAVHRAALKEPRASHTVLTNLFSGGLARGISNRLIQELGAVNPIAPLFPHASGALAPLRTAAERLGRDDFSALWAGQNVTGCREIPAAQLTRDLMPGATSRAL